MSAGARLEARVRPAAELAPAERLEMYRVYEAHYDATSRELFLRDLEAKTHVIELRSEGVLRGFSTAQLMAFDHDGTSNRAIFSGDTIIDSRFWGEQALVHAFCRWAGQVKAQQPARPLYWFLISKGYRTYRYLSVFAHDYHPHHARPTTAALASRLELLARAKFGAAFDAETGLIRFPVSMGQLRAPLTSVRANLREHPAVRFFLERNPGFHRGDELACLTELTTSNLRSFARGAFLEGLGMGERDLAA